MKIYLVGGAVRDALLGLPVQERDWVVVGATPQQMLALGYKPVGKDFPVFLHPQTHEQYALARTEKKIAKGYTGFSFHAAPDVTLEEDLQRRDLTINAIAQAPDGKLIDLFAGQQDLQHKILRHISPAFAEDPVRILRTARFAARFNDFTVHSTTNQLMHNMVKNQEVNALVAERVWQELAKALVTQAPWRFFEVLQACHALPILFTSIDTNFATAIKALKTATNLTPAGHTRFAAMLGMLDAAATNELCKKYRAPHQYRDLAKLVGKHYATYQNILNFAPEELLIFLEQLDVWRRPPRFTDFMTACEAIFNKTPQQKLAQSQRLQTALQLTTTITAQPLMAQGIKGDALRLAIHKKRREILQSRGV